MEDTAYRKATLPNGLRVMTAAMPHTRSVAVSIYVGAGSRYETPAQAGLAHFIEHLCFKGTEHRPTSEQISQEIDAVGGLINAATDRELTVFYCKVPQPSFDLAIDVLSDLVRRPIFAADELERERSVVLEELATIADSPHQQVDLLLDETVWPDQALGRDVAGTESTVRGLTRDMAFDYLHHQYAPNNMVVSIAGAVTHERALELACRAFGGWARGVPTGWFAAVNGQHEARAAVKYKKTEQAHLSLALRGIPMQHPDRYALSLLSVILGEGMSNRLSLELRERRALCYDVHSYCSYFLDAGTFALYAGVDPTKARDALQALLAELSRLRDEPIPDDEIARAKALTKGRILLRMEDTRAVSDWLGVQELLTGHVRTADEVSALIDAVTPENMRRVAQQVINDKQLSLAVLGPFRSAGRFLQALHL